jgi:Phage derived protein Gp49-like (DUF891)
MIFGGLGVRRPPGFPIAIGTLQAEGHALQVVRPRTNASALRAFHFHPLPFVSQRREICNLFCNIALLHLVLRSSVEYIAYKGQEFQIEWYFSPKGESQALEYYRQLTPAERIKVLKLFRMMAETGRIRDEAKFRNEGDKIYAFKPQPHRFLNFFVEGRRIIVTNAFWKKQDKLPKGEKERALKCMESYRTRTKEGNYYEEEK